MLGRPLTTVPSSRQPARSHRPAATYSHDAAGNNLNTAAEPTSYNNQTRSPSLGGLAMKYLDLGNDIRTDAGGTELVEGPLGISARKTGTEITWYTRIPDGMILNARQGASVQNYVTEPHNQSVAALYAPNGDLSVPTNTRPTEDHGRRRDRRNVADQNPFRYISGRQETAGAEDYYKLGARYYDTNGHFTQPDPLAGIDQ